MRKKSKHRKRRGFKRSVIGFYTENGKVKPITARSRRQNKLPKNLPLWELREIHSKRSIRSQIIDEALEAKVAPSGEYWKKKMNRSDVIGVDLFPTPTVKSKKLTDDQKFALNYAVIQKALEDIYGHKTLFQKIQFEVKPLGYGTLASCATKSKPIKIYISPQVYKAIKKGKITNRDEFNAYEAVVHENLHAIVGDAKYNSLFEEGSTEILAQRFVLNHVQMPKKLREELIKNPYYSYPWYVENVSFISLIMADGDPVKAIRWLEKTKTPSHAEQDKIINEMNRKIGKILSYTYPDAPLKKIQKDTLRFCGVGPDKTKIAKKNQKLFWDMVNSMKNSKNKKVREAGKRIIEYAGFKPYWWLRV